MPAQTKRQREVLNIITRHLEANGYRPSYQAIANSLRLKSRSGIARIVADLESQGLLERQRENGHFLIKVSNSDSTVSIAWIDGEGINTAAPLIVPSFMIGSYEPDEMRVMLVDDSSMAPEIDVDDIVLIEIRDYCRNGQTVIAKLNGERIVIRKYYRAGAEIELHTADPEIAPIILPANQISILGIYRGLLRSAF